MFKMWNVWFFLFCWFQKYWIPEKNCDSKWFLIRFLLVIIDFFAFRKIWFYYSVQVFCNSLKITPVCHKRKKCSKKFDGLRSNLRQDQNPGHNKPKNFTAGSQDSTVAIPKLLNYSLISFSKTHRNIYNEKLRKYADKRIQLQKKKIKFIASMLKTGNIGKYCTVQRKIFCFRHLEWRNIAEECALMSGTVPVLIRKTTWFTCSPNV